MIRGRRLHARACQAPLPSDRGVGVRARSSRRVIFLWKEQRLGCLILQHTSLRRPSSVAVRVRWRERLIGAVPAQPSMRFGFEHSYSALPPHFYARVSPTTVADPLLVVFNQPLSEELGRAPRIIDRGRAHRSGGDHLCFATCPADTAPPRLPHELRRKVASCAISSSLSKSA